MVPKNTFSKNPCGLTVEAFGKIFRKSLPGYSRNSCLKKTSLYTVPYSPTQHRTFFPKIPNLLPTNSL